MILLSFCYHHKSLLFNLLLVVNVQDLCCQVDVDFIVVNFVSPFSCSECILSSISSNRSSYSQLKIFFYYKNSNNLNLN